MASYNSNLKTWGASGSEFPDGYSYAAGDQPVDAWDNFVNSNLINDISHLVSLTNQRIESESGAAGGEPNSPEASHLYHDQGNERLRLWNAANSSWDEFVRRGGDTMTGVLDMGGYQIEDSSGTLTLSGNVNVSSTLTQSGNNVATQTWVNNNADVPDADYADSAGNADTLDGNHASYFTTLTEVNNNADVPNANYADSAGDANTLDGNDSSYFTTLTEVNNNADVPNADYADNAGKLNGNTYDDVRLDPGKHLSAESFTESNLTVNHSSTEISGGDLVFGGVEQGPTESFNHDGNHDATDEGEYGCYFVPNIPITKIVITVGDNVGYYIYTSVEVQKSSTGETVFSTSGKYDNEDTTATIVPDSPFEAGVEYELIVTGYDDGSYDVIQGDGTWASNVLPRSNYAADVTDGINSGTRVSNDIYAHGQIDFYTKATSGSATMEFDTNSYVARQWDQALFSDANNAGNVDVYLEQSTDGGSTWTEVAGPISPGHDISSYSNDSLLRLRADLSRSRADKTSPAFKAGHLRYLI
jgi:hypothetical protein